MTKYKYLILLVVITLLLSVGCTTKSSNDGVDYIAYVSANADSEYENTFKELNIGVLFDFNFKLPKANQSEVNIWVEGYKDGEIVEPYPLRQLTYHSHPNEEIKGKMGLGIISPGSDQAQLFLYSDNVRMNPRLIEKDFFVNHGSSSWGYAIDSEFVGLESGKEIILAVYGQADGSMRIIHDYQDQEEINKMIEEHRTVLLLKMRVEERKM
ncbi:hypothetical protein RH915_10130 [Serpentinicella sp. ANB-PHB4]|uniref:hypothetical protein n=1 Tax=Serpentinicella sp. ANB-PHB4 TaxID=3074076 RepID=UPI00286765D1|nr:hypothetical protein [Serpentinicella sp. ANB-PHB4]MDR5659846.1 hypothetical protein [Serpentinicella sp. ANB-PHB4]